MMDSSMVRAVGTSRPEVGSSRIRIGGSCSMVRAMAVFCFMPVESLSVRDVGEAIHIEQRNQFCNALAQAVRASIPFRRPKKFENFARRQAGIQTHVARKKADLLANLAGLACQCRSRPAWRCRRWV